MQGSPQLSQAGQVFSRVESLHNNPVPTTPTKVDPDHEERRDNFRDCLCAGTQCRSIQVVPLTRGTQGAYPSQRGKRSFYFRGGLVFN